MIFLFQYQQTRERHRRTICFLFARKVQLWKFNAAAAVKKKRKVDHTKLLSKQQVRGNFTTANLHFIRVTSREGEREIEG